LKSKSGRALGREAGPVTSENVAEFTPAADTIAEATRRLRELGFTVAQPGVTLTIIGEPNRFEEVFNVKLAIKRDEAGGGVTVHAAGGIVIPKSLRDVVEDVVFPEPPEFFG